MFELSKSRNLCKGVLYFGYADIDFIRIEVVSDVQERMEMLFICLNYYTCEKLTCKSHHTVELHRNLRFYDNKTNDIL